MNKDKIRIITDSGCDIPHGSNAGTKAIGVVIRGKPRR
jgi:fatty acid-binding protein DegV